MRPKFLLDENIESILLDYIAEHNQSSIARIEAIRVGDSPDLPLGSSDPDILLWAQRHGYIVISHDVSTLLDHFGNHLAAGRHCPGIFFISGHANPRDIVEILAAASETNDPLGWNDLVEYLG